MFLALGLQSHVCLSDIAEQFHKGLDSLRLLLELHHQIGNRLRLFRLGLRSGDGGYSSDGRYCNDRRDNYRPIRGNDIRQIFTSDGEHCFAVLEVFHFLSVKASRT